MTDILSDLNKEIYLTIASTLAGIMVTKIFDFFYPDAIKVYTTDLCVDKPSEIAPTLKLPQIYEEDAVQTPELGYKKFKYGKTEDMNWKITIPEDAVDKRTRIHLYTTISTKPDTKHHYFYYKIRFKDNTDDPEITTFCKRYHQDDYTNPIYPPSKTVKFNKKKNIIVGSHCFESKINDVVNGKEVGTEQIGLTFGGSSGEYIVEEAYISDKQINIKKCGCTYIFWRCYTNKPKYVTNEP